MIKVDWIDRLREPQNPPDPKYPDGVDADLSEGKPHCLTQLPYPARRCGYFFLKCTTCATTAIITTAGRRDDPRSIKLKCKRKLQ